MRRRALRIAAFAAPVVLVGCGLAVASGVVGPQRGDGGDERASSAAKRRPKWSGLRIVARPSTLTTKPGAAVSTTIFSFRPRLRRARRLANGGTLAPALSRVPRRTAYRLRVVGTPVGARALLRPRILRARSGRLTILTSAATRPGTYTLYVSATRTRAHRAPRRRKARARASDLVTKHRRPRRLRPARTIVRLVVRRPGASAGRRDPSGFPFPITGDARAGALAPGVSQPIDLAIGNPYDEPLTVTRLTATLLSIHAPNATAALPCRAEDDFTIRQYAGPQFEVPAGGRPRLSELGVAAHMWPAVTMTDRQTNQDGCKGATIAIAYSGTARGGSP